MNFAAMLLRAPVISAKPKRTYNPNKIKPVHRASPARYRLYLEGQERSIADLAELMGNTYEGTRSAITRMSDRGQVTRTKKSVSNGHGRTPALYTWVA